MRIIYSNDLPWRDSGLKRLVPKSYYGPAWFVHLWRWLGLDPAVTIIHEEPVMIQDAYRMGDTIIIPTSQRERFEREIRTRQDSGRYALPSWF